MKCARTNWYAMAHVPSNIWLWPKKLTRLIVANVRAFLYFVLFWITIQKKTNEMLPLWNVWRRLFIRICVRKYVNSNGKKVWRVKPINHTTPAIWLHSHTQQTAFEFGPSESSALMGPNVTIHIRTQFSQYFMCLCVCEARTHNLSLTLSQWAHTHTHINRIVYLASARWVLC